MLVGLKPYSKKSDEEIMTCVQAGDRLQPPDNWKDDLYATMLSCWNQNAAARPSLQDLEDHFVNASNHRLPSVSSVKSSESMSQVWRKCLIG